MAAPRATENTSIRTRTTSATPIGTLPHSFLLRQLTLPSTGSAFSEKWFSDASRDAEDESEGSAGTVLLCAAAELLAARLPVWVSGL